MQDADESCKFKRLWLLDQGGSFNGVTAIMASLTAQQKKVGYH